MKEEIKDMLKVSRILFKYNVPVEEAKQIGSYIEKLVYEKQKLKENNQAMQEELARVWAKLNKKEEIINKAKEYLKKYFYKDDLRTKTVLEILDNKGE